MDTKELGKRIQDLLIRKGISRKEFSQMTGLTEAAISRYCTGAREPKSLALGAMASALDVSVDELLGTPSEDTEVLGDAVRLVARSANKISDEDKELLIKALLELNK